MPDTGVIEITEPIELKVVGDRMHFTCISGTRRTIYSISLHKAANAAMCSAVLIEQERSRVLPDNVREFIRKNH